VEKDYEEIEMVLKITSRVKLSLVKLPKGERS